MATLSEFNTWLIDNPATECGICDKIIWTKLDDSIHTYTPPQVCDLLENQQWDVNDMKKWEMEGDGDEGPWSTVDELQGGDIIRDENNGKVPRKFKRPLGT